MLRGTLKWLYNPQFTDHYMTVSSKYNGGSRFSVPSVGVVKLYGILSVSQDLETHTLTHLVKDEAPGLSL